MEKFEEFRRKMRDASIHPRTIDIFEKYYRRLSAGETGLIPEETIAPLDSLPSSNDLGDFDELGTHHLKKSVVIKLNGGLGTSMGMDRAKSLLKVKSDLSFLDIIARQNLRIRSDCSCVIPLIMMNSETTRDDTLTVLHQYSDLAVKDIPFDFVQSRVPKVRQSDLLPAVYPPEPDLEWNPPGHGDIYASLMISGCLDRLLDNGYTYSFISNADNLGAELTPSILGYFVARGHSFMMEVAERTDADRKGGHLARHRDGYLVLREIAQCASDDLDSFSNVNRHRFFNTNSIWVHLEQLRDMLKRNDGYLGLPLIRNSKTVNPRDMDSEPVFQMETAMGAAISSFENSTAICVPRSRFLPVKTTDDLIGLWSDAYHLSEKYQITLAPGRSNGVITNLDKKHYRMFSQLEERFPSGAPSLVGCDTWEVHGDIVFEGNVTIIGSSRIINPSSSQGRIPSGTIIRGDYSVS